MKWTRFTTFATLAALTLAFGAGWATAQTAKPASHATDSAFSFAVYGDSRTMMYLPPKEAQKEETIKLMVNVQPGDAGENRGRGRPERC
jgi:poly(3-hydroxybutyrate) depolymerase